MTINKSQSQALENVSLYLPKPVFSQDSRFWTLPSRVGWQTPSPISSTEKLSMANQKKKGMRHDSLYKYDCIHHVCFSFLSMKLEWKNSLLYKTHLCRFKRRRWEFRQQFIIYVNTKQQGNQLITIKITPSSINSLFKKKTNINLQQETLLFQVHSR